MINEMSCVLLCAFFLFANRLSKMLLLLLLLLLLLSATKLILFYAMQEIVNIMEGKRLQRAAATLQLC